MPVGQALEPRARFYSSTHLMNLSGFWIDAFWSMRLPLGLCTLLELFKHILSVYDDPEDFVPHWCFLTHGHCVCDGFEDFVPHWSSLCLCLQACTQVCDGLEGFVPQLILFMHLYWSASVLRFLYLGTFLKHCAHYVRLTKNFCSWMILFRVLFRHHASPRSRLCGTVDSPCFCRASRLPKWLPAWLYATALSLEENAHRA